MKYNHEEACECGHNHTHHHEESCGCGENHVYECACDDDCECHCEEEEDTEHLHQPDKYHLALSKYDTCLNDEETARKSISRINITWH